MLRCFSSAFTLVFIDDRDYHLYTDDLSTIYGGLRKRLRSRVARVRRALVWWKRLDRDFAR
jgi:hypothetical protein